MSLVSSEKILVDTSVFVQFFRGNKTDTFEALVQANRVLLSRYVRLELLQGVRRGEMQRLLYVLDGLELVPFTEEHMVGAEIILNSLKGSGLTVGVVDLLIAAQARVHQCAIYSFDGIFAKLHAMGVIPGVHAWHTKTQDLRGL